MMPHEEHQEPASKSISSGIACPETEFLPQNSVSSLGNPVGCTLRFKRLDKEIKQANSARDSKSCDRTPIEIPPAFDSTRSVTGA